MSKKGGQARTAAQKAIDRKTYRPALKRYLIAGLDEAGGKSQGDLLSIISKRSNDPDHPDMSRSTLERICKSDGERKPEYAWLIGQALWDLGSKSSSGIFALAACGCDEQLLGVLGNVVLNDSLDEDIQTEILRIASLVTNVWFTGAFCRPIEWENELLYPSIEAETIADKLRIVENLRRPREKDPGISVTSEANRDNQKKLDSVRAFRAEQLSLITFTNAKAIAALEQAWASWFPEYRYYGKLPFKFATWIGRLALVSGERADRGLRIQVWQEVCDLFEELLALQKAPNPSRLTELLDTKPPNRS